MKILRLIAELLLLLILLPIMLVGFLIGLFFPNFREKLKFQADINQAKAAEVRYQQGGGIPAIDEAIAAWERILNHAEFTHVDEAFRLKVLNDSAGTYLRRYWAKGILENLNMALSFWEETVKLTPDNSPELPSFLNNLGNGLIERYARLGDLNDLQKAIQSYKKAVKLTPDNSPELPSFLNSLGNGLINRYARLGELNDLQEALKVSQQAVKLTPDNSPNFPMYLNNQGNGLINRYARLGKLNDLQEALKVYQQAVKLTPDNLPDLPMYLNNQGNGLINRYARLGEINDLQEALKVYQQAVKLTPDNSPDLPSFFNNLGSSLRDRYVRLSELNDLQEAITVFQQAVKLTPNNSPNLPVSLNNLGTGLRDRYARLYELNDLQEAIKVSQQAVKLTPDKSPDFPSLLNNLGTGLSNRYARLGELNDLQEAIKNYKKVVKLTPDNSPDFPSSLNNLGTGLSDRYQRLGDLNDLSEAITNYQQGAKRGLEVALEIGLGTARNWLRWAFDREAWSEVIDAYQYAYQAGTQLVKTQLTREHQTAFLKDSQGLAAHAAYAFAKNHQFTDAVVTLERGLAQLLSEALARDRADLEQLKIQEHNDLYDRYQQAVNDWHEAQQFAKTFEHPTDEQSEKIYHHFRTAREALDNTITAIRQVDGYANFLMAPEFADIVAAVKSSILVYLVVTKAGGLVLIVNENEKITPVWLPELTEESLEHTLANMEPPDTGYLRAYNDWLTHPKESTYHQQWLTSLESTTQLLWEQVMVPLIQALPKSAQVTLIPVGQLGLLPFHAAWTEDNNTPTGKRYALDELTISYAPNARSLTEARKVAHRVAADHLLAVDEPKPVKESPLPSSEYEVQTVIANFAQHHIFKHEAATRQAILNALANCTVLHFSCHGVANLNKPLESALIMANNEPLTVKDFLDLRLNGVRLATLSACETGIPGMELPDEVVNLPAGLLQAGVAGVVASLWSVSDMSTALLMTKFYQNVTTLWQEQGTQASIAPALQAAQCWLRDATKKELEQRIKELSINATQRRELRRLFNKMKPQTKPYTDSYYWAAFSAIGV
jgi:CHAT domain-containing protein